MVGDPLTSSFLGVSSQPAANEFSKTPPCAEHREMSVGDPISKLLHLLPISNPTTISKVTATATLQELRVWLVDHQRRGVDSSLFLPPANRSSWWMMLSVIGGVVSPRAQWKGRPPRRNREHASGRCPVSPGTHTRHETQRRNTIEAMQESFNWICKNINRWGLCSNSDVSPASCNTKWRADNQAGARQAHPLCCPQSVNYYPQPRRSILSLASNNVRFGRKGWCYYGKVAISKLRLKNVPFYNRLIRNCNPKSPCCFPACAFERCCKRVRVECSGSSSI